MGLFKVEAERGGIRLAGICLVRIVLNRIRLNVIWFCFFQASMQCIIHKNSLEMVMADFVIEQKLFVSGIRETERSAVDRISGKCSFYQWILTKSIAYLSRFGIIK